MQRKYKNLVTELSVPSEFVYYLDVFNNTNISHKELYDAIVAHYDAAYVNRNVTFDSNKNILWHHGKFLTKKFFELEAKFNEFIVDKPWVKEYYEFAVDYGFYARLGENYHASWVNVTKVSNPEKHKEFRDNFNYKNFMFAYSDKTFTLFNELRRKVPYVAGNLVILREKYKGSVGHDPFYRSNLPKDTPRIGTIMSITDKTHDWSKNGKGSRLVEVLWAATGQISTASINSIKLVNRTDKVVDRLEER